MLDKILEFIPPIPIAEKTKDFTDWLTETFAFLFDPIKEYFGSFMEFASETLLAVPPIIIIIIVALLAFFISGKKFGLAAFSIVGLWLVYNQGFWDYLIDTFTLVLISSVLSVIIGVPVGILMSKSKIAEAIITPILDFMQTMPAFVYLIPAVAFFVIGMVLGIFASLIFATPPAERFTNLGLR